MNNVCYSELEHQFSLDALDDWETTSGLVESAIRMMRDRLPEAEARIFSHASEAREYREIDREGLSSIPEDSLFIACLSMCGSGVPLSSFFNDFVPDDSLLRYLLEDSYGGFYIVPVVHRFSLLAFILLCAPEGAEKPDTILPAEASFLVDLIGRLRINLYAASIADSRQRELLKLAEFPQVLRSRQSVAELTSRILDDLQKEVAFDAGVYYEFEEYLDRLLPVVWQGIPEAPPVLAPGDGISGHTMVNRKAISVPDRARHPSFSHIEGEAFLQGSFLSVPIYTDKRLIGVVSLCRYSDNPHPLGVEHRYTLEIAASFLATEINNRQLYDELEQSYFSTVSSLSRALEAKDHYTRGHSERVMTLAVGIAHELGLSAESTRRIRYAAILHDIGKIGISDSIITKQSSLTTVEYAEIKRHTDIGYDIVNDSRFFEDIRDLIKYHHEKMDGTGYYAKQKGDYPWEAMIISIADIYDALTSERPYREAFSESRALKSLEELIGIHFDRRIFDAFKSWLSRSRSD